MGNIMQKEVDQPGSSEGVGRETEIYTQRFTSAEEAVRASTWKVLVRDFLQQYVSPQDTVIDIGAGDGHFITNIRAARRVALDLSSHVSVLGSYGVEVLQAPATELTTVFDSQADVIFMSNFLEHLPNKRLVIDVLEECRRGLKPGGKLLILQPNIRYTGPAYWDYIDHHISLTEHSLVEALEISGFEVIKLIPRFLPYTAKSSLGRLSQGAGSELFVKWYLRLPILWRIFGKQTFVVAVKRSEEKDKKI